MEIQEFIGEPDKKLMVLDVVKEDCQWTELILANGDKIRARLVPNQVLLDPNMPLAPDGCPPYQVGWTIQMIVRQV